MTRTNWLCRIGLLLTVAQCTRSRRHVFSIHDLTGVPCAGVDRVTIGVCMSQHQCKIQESKVIGDCGVYAICCYKSPYDTSSNKKIAIFENLHTQPAIQQYLGHEYSYHVTIHSAHVCQMRVDFEEFYLAPPTTVYSPDNLNLTQGPGFTCKNDIFRVTKQQPSADFIPLLCGNNTGQHLYIRVDPSLNISHSVHLKLTIADRYKHPNLPRASWKIKVTQLECFNTGVETAIPSTADSDEYLISPPGCLQYYPDRSGSFESFNYNGGLGPYPGNLAYATCFRRTSDICGIRFKAQSFEVAHHNEDNVYTDSDCQVNPVAHWQTLSEDYLFIPEAETSEGLRASKFCGQSIANQSIVSSPPGPLYVNFHSDNLVTDYINENGYKFSYIMIGNCSRL